VTPHQKQITIRYLLKPLRSCNIWVKHFGHTPFAMKQFDDHCISDLEAQLLKIDLNADECSGANVGMPFTAALNTQKPLLLLFEGFCTTGSSVGNILLLSSLHLYPAAGQQVMCFLQDYY
jgi:hypothetical protein